MAFPVLAKCVTYDAGWPKESAKVRAAFNLGEVYAVRFMEVGQSLTTLEFYEVPGQWNSVFFDAVPDDEDDEDGG